MRIDCIPSQKFYNKLAPVHGYELSYIYLNNFFLIVYKRDLEKDIIAETSGALKQLLLNLYQVSMQF